MTFAKVITYIEIVLFNKQKKIQRYVRNSRVYNIVQLTGYFGLSVTLKMFCFV